MRRKFTLEYWIDEGWYVGRLKEIPGVFSQGENLEELKENIIYAYKLVMSEGKFEFSLLLEPGSNKDWKKGWIDVLLKYV